MEDHVNAISLLIANRKDLFVEYLLENEVIPKNVFFRAIDETNLIVPFGRYYNMIERHFGFDVDNDAATIRILFEKNVCTIWQRDMPMDEKIFFSLVDMGGRFSELKTYILDLAPKLFLYYVNMGYHTIGEYVKVLTLSGRAKEENVLWILDNLDSTTDIGTLCNLAKNLHDYSFPSVFFYRVILLLQDTSNFNLIVFYLTATVYDYPNCYMTEYVTNSESSEELTYIWYSEKVYNSQPDQTFDKYPDLTTFHKLYFSKHTIKKMCCDLHLKILHMKSAPFEVAHIQKYYDEIIPFARSLIDELNHIQ